MSQLKTLDDVNFIATLCNVQFCTSRLSDLKFEQVLVAHHMGCVKGKRAFEHAQNADSNHPVHVQHIMQVVAFRSYIVVSIDSDMEQCKP